MNSNTRRCRLTIHPDLIGQLNQSWFQNIIADASGGQMRSIFDQIIDPRCQSNPRCNRHCRRIQSQKCRHHYHPFDKTRFMTVQSAKVHLLVALLATACHCWSFLATFWHFLALLVPPLATFWNCWTLLLALQWMRVMWIRRHHWSRQSHQLSPSLSPIWSNQQLSPIWSAIVTKYPQSVSNMIWSPIVPKWQFKPLLIEQILMAPGTWLLCSNLIGFLFGQACSPLVAQLLLSCLTKLDGQQHLSCLAYHHPPRQGGWEAPVGVDWPTSISCLGSTQLNWADPPILSEDGHVCTLPTSSRF